MKYYNQLWKLKIFISIDQPYKTNVNLYFYRKHKCLMNTEVLRSHSDKKNIK